MASHLLAEFMINLNTQETLALRQIGRGSSPVILVRQGVDGDGEDKYLLRGWGWEQAPTATGNGGVLDAREWQHP